MRRANGTSGDPSGKFAVDTYLLWDELTRFARHGGNSSANHWPVLLELASTSVPSQLEAWSNVEDSDKRKRLLDALKSSFAWASQSRIHTALISDDLRPCLQAALNNGFVSRYTLGAACSFSAADAVAASVVGPPQITNDKRHTFGVIDDGCCVVHEHFLGRILALWDQDPASEPDPSRDWWKRQARQGLVPCPYGMEVVQADLPLKPGLGEAEERAWYRRFHRGTWGHPDHTHGARVMHLLAGRLKDADSAAEMPLIFVQLPPQTVTDTSGDSLGVHVVDGARYIVDRTQSFVDGGAWSTTINISVGSIAGPHDGTSMAELALADLVNQPPTSNGSVDVVVAAGNAADGQAVHLLRDVKVGSPGRFLVRVPPQCTRDSFVEFWLPDATDPAVDAFSVVVSAPGGQTLARALKPGQMVAFGDGAEAEAAVIFARKVAQGTRGTMILLCVAPTAHARGADGQRSLSSAGIWTIDVCSTSQTAGEVHGWIERDDIIVGERRRQQTRFVFDQVDRDDPRSDLWTLASLANPGASSKVVVAAGYVDAKEPPYPIARYSGMGPLRGDSVFEGRLVYAPSERSFTLRGLAVPGFFSGSRSVLNGTSAAAPMVARLLALKKLSFDAVSQTQSGKPEPSTNPPVEKALRRMKGDKRPLPGSEHRLPPDTARPGRERTAPTTASPRRPAVVHVLNRRYSG